MRAILVFVMVSLAACAGDPSRVEGPAQTAADRLESPTRPLSSFAEYELTPMTFISAIEKKEGALKKGQEFEQSLNEKLSPLLESWRASGSEDNSDSLSIETKLIRMRIVSQAARFFTPSIVMGDSHIDLDLRLVNTTTGDEIANVKIRTNARKWGSAYTGVRDETIDEYAVAIVYDYLLDNY